MACEGLCFFPEQLRAAFAEITKAAVDEAGSVVGRHVFAHADNTHIVWISARPAAGIGHATANRSEVCSQSGGAGVSRFGRGVRKSVYHSAICETSPSSPSLPSRKKLERLQPRKVRLRGSSRDR